MRERPLEGLRVIKSTDPILTGQRRKTRSWPNGWEKDEDRGSSDDNDSDDDRRLVIAVRVRAARRRETGGRRVRVLELGAIGRRHYSHRLRLPHGPIGLFSSSPSSPSSTSLPHAITAARFCPSLFLTLSGSPWFSSSRSSSFDIPACFFHSTLPLIVFRIPFPLRF